MAAGRVNTNHARADGPYRPLPLPPLVRAHRMFTILVPVLGPKGMKGLGTMLAHVRGDSQRVHRPFDERADSGRVIGFAPLPAQGPATLRRPPTRLATNCTQMPFSLVLPATLLWESRIAGALRR